jgi:hypothetical protein
METMSFKVVHRRKPALLKLREKKKETLKSAKMINVMPNIRPTEITCVLSFHKAGT